MRHGAVLTLFALGLLSFPQAATAQGSTDRNVELHQNVRLIETPVPPDMAADLKSSYQHFLPLFEQVVKEHTADETAECSLTLRITAGMKEVGSPKIPRAFARVVAFRKNSKREYEGRLFMHSFVTDGPVNADEIATFLKWILGLVNCKAAGPSTCI